ncbi:DUF4190 domain-containing protein [Actinoplanes sp. KI2]|uniref:DUF4190 domain-containing protein n=1 Tax=Actinoplanes sp. KI2 TaxID=2983315 RepID=UPI0021D57AEA|nr:DUF4190 domain-containing protein [Actinoplanes sp. KI2]MCU7727600.1 DUF4190 domain-containing protein [Actinoplanes sp. KI2]
MSINEQLPPQPGQNYNYPAPPTPQQPQGRSGLAVAGFILAIIAAPIGFILSLIAIFKTGAGKAKGRGLAVAGVIISLVLMAGGVIVGAVVLNSTYLDPGCTDGKAAIINNASTTPNAATIQKTIDELNAAAAKATHDEVRDAMTTLANDYQKVLDAAKTGSVPPSLLDQVNKDGEKIDSLCTIGG